MLLVYGQTKYGQLSDQKRVLQEALREVDSEAIIN